jgi:hypothetical protein
MQTITTGAARANGALRLPSDVAAYLKRHGLELGDILTDSNPKLAKGAAIARAVIHHTLPGRALAAAINPGNGATVAPRAYLPTLAARCEALGLTDKARRHNACPWATAGCSDACLTWAGHGGLSADVAACRGRRTLAMIDNPETYGRAMVWAIARQWQRAQVDGLPLAVRLRGTDDQPWHRLTVSVSLAEAVTIRRRFGLLIANGENQTIAQILAPAVAEGSCHLYEYSKAPTEGPLGLRAQWAAGWDVTASLAGDRATAARDAMAAIDAGFRLAVPIAIAKGAPIPAYVTISYNGRSATLPAIDGDATDHRWADPNGVAVILRGKRSRGADPKVAGFILPLANTISLPDGRVDLTYYC